MRTSGSTVQTALGPVDCIVEGTGVPVVVLHGTPGGIDSADIMSTFLPRERFRVVLLSRPGYLATELFGRNRVDDQADLIAALLDTIGIGSAAVLGWSGGGPAAFRFAVRHPQRAAAVVNVAAASHQMPIPRLDGTSRLLFNTAVGRWFVRQTARRQPGQIVTGTLQHEGDLTSEQLKAAAAQVMADDTQRQFVLDLSATVNEKGNRQAGYEADKEQFENLPDLELERISTPTLLVHGEVDNDVPPEHTASAAARIPGARTRILPLGTHLALWAHADAAQAQREVIDFLVTTART
jgi:pimeloyl-ACP methyl ester carboxylesterase